MERPLSKKTEDSGETTSGRVGIRRSLKILYERKNGCQMALRLVVIMNRQKFNHELTRKKPLFCVIWWFKFIWTPD